jgi:hypothetical protein
MVSQCDAAFGIGGEFFNDRVALMVKAHMELM